MKISELIKWLEALKKEQGDIVLYREVGLGRGAWREPIYKPNISFYIRPGSTSNGKPTLIL